MLTSHINIFDLKFWVVFQTRIDSAINSLVATWNYIAAIVWQNADERWNRISKIRDKKLIVIKAWKSIRCFRFSEEISLLFLYSLCSTSNQSPFLNWTLWWDSVGFVSMNNLCDDYTVEISVRFIIEVLKWLIWVIYMNVCKRRLFSFFTMQMRIEK